jgi:xylulose-5-phosphate/fructose-6-phosphate phosphoketolase
VPTLEALAAAEWLRHALPELRLRVVNVVDLMCLVSPSEHPHGLSDQAFDALFTADKPVVFAFHGYPSLIHQLIYRRRNHDAFHVHGYREEGTTTTPFDMTVLNQLDRFHLAAGVLKRIPRFGNEAAPLRRQLDDILARHQRYVREHGEDLPEVKNWRWGAAASGREETGPPRVEPY